MSGCCGTARGPPRSINGLADFANEGIFGGGALASTVRCAYYRESYRGTRGHSKVVVNPREVDIAGSKTIPSPFGRSGLGRPACVNFTHMFGGHQRHDRLS
jgi:hypothetical protein